MGATEFNDIWAALLLAQKSMDKLGDAMAELDDEMTSALVKLRAAVEDAENKLTALTNQRGAASEPSPPHGPATVHNNTEGRSWTTGQGGGGKADGQAGSRAQDTAAPSPVAAPRNLSGERPVESLEPAFVRRSVAYYNGGPCATCGEIAFVPFVPRPDGGALSCMKCYAKEMGARR